VELERKRSIEGPDVNAWQRKHTSPIQLAATARVIPGSAEWDPGARKKPPQSLAVLGPGSEPVASHWTVPHPLNLRGSLAAVLPRPDAQCGAWHLLTNVTQDFLLIALGFFLTNVLAVAGHNTSARGWPDVRSFFSLPAHWFGLVLMYGALATLHGYAQGLYRTDAVRGRRDEMLLVLNTLLWPSLLACVVLWLLRVNLMPVWMVLLAGAMNACLIYAWRNSQRANCAGSAPQPQFKHVLIIGTGMRAGLIADHIAHNPGMRRAVRGFLDDHAGPQGAILGRLSEFAAVARSEFIDEIVVTIPLQREAARRIIYEAQQMQLDVKFVPDVLGWDDRALGFERFGNLPVITLNQTSAPEAQLFCKRVIDVIGASAGLILLAPLLALIALIIQIDSAGPVLYCAPRLGRKGVRFRCYKFRTMVSNASQRKDALRRSNERDGPIFKLRDDPRITRVGRFLRRYSLDELPQLFNVVKGDMSLVGPRPHPLDDCAQYDLEHLQRLDVTPGITGLWQVTARSSTSFQQSMQLDLEYIRRWSLGMDLRILCRTAWSVLKGEGC
jgi:exopolysaccharide biosynthesis polyprenyl glycosylphosphotransferase